MTQTWDISLSSSGSRVALGGVFIAHGSQKLFGWFGGGGVEGTSKGMPAMVFRPAKPSANRAGVSEAVASVALALGLATPAVGAAAATTMGVAASVHAPNGFFATEGGLEYPAVLALAAASFTIGGPGPYSLDSLTGHVLDRPWMRVTALAVVPHRDPDLPPAESPGQRHGDAGLRNPGGRSLSPAPHALA